MQVITTNREYSLKPSSDFGYGWKQHTSQWEMAAAISQQLQYYRLVCKQKAIVGELTFNTQPYSSPTRCGYFCKNSLSVTDSVFKWPFGYRVSFVHNIFFLWCFILSFHFILFLFKKKQHYMYLFTPDFSKKSLYPRTFIRIHEALTLSLLICNLEM
jgi:hypothetical protein